MVLLEFALMVLVPSGVLPKFSFMILVPCGFLLKFLLMEIMVLVLELSGKWSSAHIFFYGNYGPGAKWISAQIFNYGPGPKLSFAQIFNYGFGPGALKWQIDL